MNKKLILFSFFALSFHVIKTEGFLDWLKKRFSFNEENQQKAAFHIKQSKIYTFDNRKVAIVQGDLFALSEFVKQEQDSSLYTIVNPTNERLQLQVGIGAEIKKRDTSGVIQTQCNQLIKENGIDIKRTKFLNYISYYTKHAQKEVPAASTFLTSSGTLLKKYHIKNVMHVVTPTCTLKSDATLYSTALQRTYENIFKLLRDLPNPIRVVACPSVLTYTPSACDVLEASVTTAAKIIANEMNKIFADSKKVTPHLFIIVTKNKKEYDRYITEFDNSIKDLN